MKRRVFSKMAAAGFLGMGLSPVMKAGTNTFSEQDKKVKGVAKIGSRRELFLDDLMVDSIKGDTRRVFHEPVPREIIMIMDKPWEGNTCGYVTVFQDGDLYRMYYRASAYTIVDRKLQSRRQDACYAESIDGIHWSRPNVGVFDFEGSKNNNIVWSGVGSHNFTAFKDENPDCPPEARYKAVGSRSGPALVPFHSSDGIHWKLIQEEGILSDGAFDSQNLVFWDPNIKAYCAYYRFFRRPFAHYSSFRDIKIAVSQDFINWTEGVGIEYLKMPPAQFYTNAIKPYHRAPHIYLGMPMMYHDRGWTPALEQLPDLERRRLESGVSMRSGTALTDTLLLWSRDGVSFDRSPNTFLRPGPDRSGSWMYGNHAVAWHLVETAPSLEGADRELSLYASEFYRLGSAVKLRRYTMRLDGFASMRSSIDGGEVITPPVIFDGSRLLLNFSTSASGSVKVELQNEAGSPLPGFALNDCIELYGDTVERAAMWKGDPNLRVLAGKPVRLRFIIKDADLYSLKFN